MYFKYAEAVFKFKELNMAAQQRRTVVQGRSLSYRLRYKIFTPFRVLFRNFRVILSLKKIIFF
ncbi:MAG: hypothetical protein LBK06_04970 [Planctomycetaceae bacterium]|nr:hypothetical protein [Planctomycetaceae bacterium]